jgi:hypothetical protein
MQHLLGPALGHLPQHTATYLTSRSFFARLISSPFGKGLRAAFDFAVVACVLGAIASALRGGKYHYGQNIPEPASAVEPVLAQVDAAD